MVSERYERIPEFLTERAIGINPKHTRTRNGLNKIYALAKSYCQQAESNYQQGDYASAYVAFEQAIRINPDDANAYYGLGAISLRQGDMQSALIAFKKAVEINPKDTKVQRVLGYIYDQLGGKETG